MCKKVVSKGLCKESIYEMLLVHSVWYDLFRYDAICQCQVPQSVTIESLGQVRSNFEYDYPDRVQAYQDRVSVLAVRLNTHRYVTTRS